MKPETILPKELLIAFQKHFSTAPTIGVVSPGRVNLIGEHTDYNNLPVLPTAIGRAIKIAVRPNDRQEVLLLNSSHQFSQHKVSLSEPIVAGPPGDWGNYVRAPIHRLVERIREARGDVKGFDAVLQSDLPAAAGLSSSSALVIGICLALLAANDMEMPADEMAEGMRLAERFVGTAGGGMDQAVISLGQPGQALLIEFEPLRSTLITMPADAVLFAIQSCQKADKSGEAKWSYNRRAFECLVGMELLRKWTRANAPQVETVEEWTSLRDAYRDLDRAGLIITAVQLAAINTEPYSIQSLEGEIGPEVVASALAAKHLPPASELRAQTGIDQLQIFSRLQHVYSESKRVHECADAFEKNDINRAATLMNASHSSCRDLYHISTPTIENLVSISTAGGALATRITGAGFGGCVVAMIAAEQKTRFLKHLRDHYYDPQKRAGRIPKHLTFENVVIACEAKGGAKSYRF